MREGADCQLGKREELPNVRWLAVKPWRFART